MGCELEWVEGVNGATYASPKEARGRVVRQGAFRAWAWPRGSLAGEGAPFYEAFATEQQARDWVKAKVATLDGLATEDPHGP